MSADQNRSRWTLNDTSRVCFAVAACAFVAALCGLAIGHVFSGWMAAGGMSAIGLFYLAIGIFSMSPTALNKEDVADALANAVIVRLASFDPFGIHFPVACR